MIGLSLGALVALVMVSGWRRQIEAAPDKSPAALPSEFHSTQPDYAKWQSITEGMDEGDVIDRLGQPLAKPDPFDRNSDVAYTWEYGYVAPRSVVFPRPLMFRIWFTRGKVWKVEDPFNGAFSKDQTPTPPQPLGPNVAPAYTHYPRWLDLRWYPSSGQCPMRYEVEIGELHLNGNPDVAGGWNTKVISSAIPYLAAEAEGAGQGRWRVRAVNSSGVSDWSDYCDFSFSQ
jgi:hypothetical protein